MPIASIGLALTLGLGGLCAGSPGGQQPVKTTYDVEVSDPEGDVHPSNSSFDVVKLAIGSDGQDLIVEATFEGELGRRASQVVEVHVDVDNQLETGVKPYGTERSGFEYRSMVCLCIEVENGAACGGDLKSGEIKEYFSVAITDRYGSGWNDTAEVRRMSQAARSRVDGRVVIGKISYGALGVEPGQVIRLAVREADAGWKESSFFDEILLTLE